MSAGFVPNDEQRRIIEYAGESLRVAAGAGTGKTTAIVERIAHLVRNGVNPSRILGITFTNKAAGELNQKVVAALGSTDDDRMPEISTYHGFAASILDEFGVFIGYDGSSRLMDEGQRSELASRVLRSTDAADLDLTSLSTRRKEMLSLASAMTDNLVDAERIREAAPSTIHRTDLDEADETTTAWKKRLALAGVAEQFETEKKRLGLIEFGDLIRYAVDVVEQSPETAKEIGSRYDAVVLDEYQDTDPAQRKLLTLLFAGNVPVLAVGDTDQTIYEWRGASAENFAAFPIDFRRSDGSETETLPLSENRRSDRLIIDLANRIREELPHVAGALPLSPVANPGFGHVVTAWFNTEVSEAKWIASEIRRLHEDGTPWGDSAVLCRKRSQFLPIVEQLRSEGIPFTVASLGQLLNVPEIADLLAWLRVLDDPADETSLLRILMGGRFRLGMAAVSSLRRWCSDGPDRRLFDAALHVDEVADLDTDDRARIGIFIKLHGQLTSSNQVTSVATTLDNVIGLLGFWDELAALGPGSELTARLNVTRFTSLAQQWRPLEGFGTMGGFLRYLSALEESGNADELEQAMQTTADAVSVLTVHSAKGLEWSHVYLPAVADKVFPSRPMKFDNPDRIGELLPYELRLDSEIHADAAAVTGDARKDILRERHLHQEWRLAYVAVTRAANRIVLSGHAWDGDIKNAREPSPLWNIAFDMEDSTPGPMENISEAAPEREPFVEAAPPPDPLFTNGAPAALRRTVEDSAWIEDEYPELTAAVEGRVAQLELSIRNLSAPSLAESPKRFVVSVTNMVTLASCPQKFKWIHHDRLPRRPRRSAVAGTVFHRRVELHNLGVVAFGDGESDFYDSVADSGSPAAHRRDPWSLFEGSRYANETPIRIEAPFEIAIGDGSIRGKVDAIYEPADGHWEIVDYKSGEHRDDPQRVVQLEAYALAAAEGAFSATPPRTIDVTFAYFGGDELKNVTESVDDEWLEDARQNISTLVDKGINGPFDPNPSDDCRWCDFLHLCPAGQEFVTGQRTT